MKRILTALLLTASIAIAQPYYDTQTERLHASRQTLPQGRAGTIGLRNASEATLASVGIIPAVADSVPVGMVATGAYTVEIVDGIAHRVPTCITQAEHDAAVAAAAEAQLADNIASINVTPLELLEIIVRIKNQNTPEQYQITAEEARAIVGLVLQGE